MGERDRETESERGREAERQRGLSAERERGRGGRLGVSPGGGWRRHREAADAEPALQHLPPLREVYYDIIIVSYTMIL